MADKPTTLPRPKKKNEKFVDSPSSHKSVKSLLSSLPRHKKRNQSISSGKSVTSDAETTASLKDSGDSRSVSSVATTAPSVGSPSSSPLPLNNERISVRSKSPKPSTGSKSKDKIKKTIAKGGKLLIPKFKHKNESTPIMVETAVNQRRTNRTDDELLLTEEPVEEATDALEPAFSKDDWSVEGICERVHTIYRNGTCESVYQESNEPSAEAAADPPNGTAVSAAKSDKILKAASETPNGDEASLNFAKKSPTTLKKEILNITNSKATEGNQYIAAKLDRKISSQTRPSTDKNDLLFKILVIGDLGTGKTSIIKRYVHQFFSQHYRATIGVDFALKVLSWDENTTIRLQLWDIAGQERFGNMTRVYYKEAVGAFIVFDVTRASTFDAVLKWKQDLDAKIQLPDGEEIPCVLLANKCDQPKEGIVNNHSKMDDFCRQNKFSSWFETSAKENVNIDEAANSLISAILLNEEKKVQETEPSNGSAGIVTINSENSENSAAKKLCNFC